MTTERTLCPCCHQPLPNPDITLATPDQKYQSLVEIDDEVKRLDVLIRRLCEKRIALLQRLNAVQSPIYALPPEALSLVFQHSCPPPDFDRSHKLAVTNGESQDGDVSQDSGGNQYPQFLLGSVSSNWRQVVYSTPRLWTAIDLRTTSLNIDRSAAILFTFLTNSGQLSIGLGLRFLTVGVTQPGYLLSPTLDPLLIENAHKIRTLHLTNAPKPWFDYISHLPQLSRFSFISGSLQEPLTVNAACPRLTLHYIRHRPQLRWSTATVLHLKGVPADVCLELLMMCTNLKEFRNQDATNPQGDVLTKLPKRFFVLPHMELFEWSLDSGRPIDAAMLRSAEMPALRKLIWIEQGPRSFGRLYVGKDFLNRLPLTVSTLEIHNLAYFGDGGDSFLDYLHSNLALEHVRLHYCSHPFLGDLLRSLMPSSTDDEDHNMREMDFPKLRLITVIGPSPFDWDEFDGIMILRMLERRFFNGLAVFDLEKPFRLEFISFTVTWESEVKQRLRDMVDRGLKLEIVIDSEPVHWLYNYVDF